jgi:hypothetical protein
MSASIKENFEVTNKDKFKAILKLNGLDNKKLAKVMGLTEEYTRQMLCRTDKNPKYINLVVHLFERFLDK